MISVRVKSVFHLICVFTPRNFIESCHRIIFKLEGERLKITLFQPLNFKLKNCGSNGLCVMHHSTNIIPINLNLNVPELLILSSIPKWHREQKAPPCR